MEKANGSRENDSEDESLTIDSDEDLLDENKEENVSENRRLWSIISSQKEIPHRSMSTISNNSDTTGLDPEDDLGINMENRNTQRKTDTDIRILIAYLRSLNESRPPETIPPIELDRYLSNFFTIVKKHDGNEYEPASLRGMLCSVERYLKMKNYQASVTRDIVFVSTRHALKFKQQKLRELGKGSKKPNEPFGKVTLDKVNQLFTAREMGPYTPMSVINSMCFMFIVHFRLRKAIDHKNLLWGDIKLRSDQSGKEYILYEPSVNRGQQQDGATKNEQSRSSYMKLCIWAQPEVPERDPVGIYKLYCQKRPPNMQHSNSPFYLGITTLHPSPVQAWYRTCAMGVNKLSDLVRMIRDITGLPRAALNPPAESLLSESYTTNTPSVLSLSDIRSPVPAQTQAYQNLLHPSVPPDSPVDDRQGRHSDTLFQDHLKYEKHESLDKNIMHVNSTIEGIKNEPADFFTGNDGPAEGDQERQHQSSHLSSVSNSSRCTSANSGSVSPVNLPKPPNNADQTANRSTNMAEVMEAKRKFQDMLHTLNPDVLTEFGAWLKKIKIYRDPITGTVVCEEPSFTYEPPSTASTDVTDITNAKITLNITLTPQAIMGRGPVTVTANTEGGLHKISNNSGQTNGRDSNITRKCRPLSNYCSEQSSPTDYRHSWESSHNKRKRYASTDSRTNKIYRTSNEAPSVSNTNCADLPASDKVHKDQDSSAQDTIKPSNERSGKSSSENCQSEGGNHGSPTQLDVNTLGLTENSPNKQSITFNDTESSPLLQYPVATGNGSPSSTTIANPTTSAGRTRAEDIMSIFQPCVTNCGLPTTAPGGQHISAPSIPQAHTPIAQRLCNPTGRDLGLFIPVPVPYPGQLPANMANRIMHNPGMLAPFANPVSAHAGFLQHRGMYRPLDQVNSVTMNNSFSGSDSIN